MKKTVSLLLSIIMTISLFVGTVTFGSVGTSAAAYTVGDVDGDGVIGNNDYLELKTCIQTNADFVGTKRVLSDLNGDGLITSVDVMMMVAYLSGTVTSLAKAVDPGYDLEYNYVAISKGSNLTYNAGNDSAGGTATVTDSGAGVTLVADSDSTDENWELSLGGEVLDANKKYTVIFKLQNSVSNVGVGCVKDELIHDESGNDHHGINTFYGNYTYNSSSKEKTLRYRRGLYEISDTRDGGTRKAFPYSTSYVDTNGYVTLKLTAEYNGTTFISTLYALNTSYEWAKVTSEPVGFSSGNTFGLYFLFGSDAGSTIKLKDVAYSIEDLGTSVTPEYPTIDIIDFNVWTNHSGKAASTTSWIKSEYSPDLMGFQEVDPSWYTELKDAFKADYGYTGNPRQSGDEAGPVFYKKSVFTLLDDGTYWLTSTPTTKSKISSSGYYRIMTFAVLYHKESGNIIKFTNTHLDNESGAAREEQAKYLDKYIDQLPSYVSIVTGDFNATPSSGVFSKMTSTYGYSSLAKIAETTDGQSHKTYETGPVYDYIFIKDASRIKALVYDVRTAIEENSDHYPLYGKFQLIN